MAMTRQALRLFPPASSTGIGSLPYLQVAEALTLAARHDLFFLPEHPEEAMIPAALEGVPGLTVGSDGGWVIDVDRWRRKREPFGLAIQQAVASGELSGFEPQACRTFRPFLAQVESRKLAFAKVQLAGPATVRWQTKLSTGESASDVAELDQQLFGWLTARCLALVKAVQRAGAAPILFLDEPGLVALRLDNPRHQVVLEQLKRLIAMLQRAGALVGLHCCGQTEWGAVLGLGLDILSIDARLSLDAVLEERSAYEGFLAAGATLALGVIPTEPGAKYALEELVDSIEVSLRSAAGPQESLIARMILTPACGLALRSVADAERIVAELFEAQRLLRALAG